MGEKLSAAAALADANVAAGVLALRPDYRALLLVAEGLEPGPSDGVSEELLARAEAATAGLLAAGPVEELPHIAAWREAYRAFGAKPQRTRNSLEALTRRAAAGLPRINRLTDLYNAISVLHQVPIGGEALFILDALAPVSDDDLAAAGAELAVSLRRLGPGVRVSERLITGTQAGVSA